ncbi:MAG TPA: ribonuclease III [Erysipelothrix sp.]|jgi:ribonuclease-3 family protein|nr:ribonuclease III [Erysipelothrix sp.]
MSLTPSSVLAYLGDAVMSLQVREYLIEKGHVNPKKLLDKSILFVSAVSQAQFMKLVLKEDLLTEEEYKVYRRAYNHKFTSKAKNVDIKSYKYSTGLEALWGYWYQQKETDRLTQMWDKYKAVVEEKHETIHLLQE